MSYQSFENQAGASKSSLKLEALKLPDMTGKTVLDLGCNEGFFCFSALERGATHVTGIDKNPRFLNAAIERAKELNVSDRVLFLEKSWDDLPEGQFDVILLTSALHYASDQEAFIAVIATKLKPGGIFVFEGGLTDNEDQWTPVERGPKNNRSTVFYPNRRTFERILRKNFAPRCIGRSVDQSGDPVPRYVYQSTKIMKIVLCLSGKGGSGKTTLARFLMQKDLPVLATDNFTRSLATQNSELGEAVKTLSEGRGLGKVYREIADSDLAPKIADALVAEVASMDSDENVLIVEGTLFRYKTFWDLFAERLEKQSIVLWRAARPQ